MIFEYKLTQNTGLMLETYLVSNTSNTYPIGSTTFKVHQFNLPVGILKRFISVGNFGTDRNELLEVTSNAGNLLTTTVSTKSHKANEPVFVTEAYKARIYTSTSKDGIYATPIDSLLYDFSDNSVKFDLPSTTGWFKVVLLGKDSTADVEITTLSKVEPFQIQDNSQAFQYTTEDDVTSLLPIDIVDKIPARVVVKCIRDAEVEYNAYIAEKGCTIPLDVSNPNYGLIKGMVEDQARCCILKYLKCDCTQQQLEVNEKKEMLISGKLFKCGNFNVSYTFKCKDKCNSCSSSCDCDDCRIIRREY